MDQPAPPDHPLEGGPQAAQGLRVVGTASALDIPLRSNVLLMVAIWRDKTPGACRVSHCSNALRSSNSRHQTQRQFGIPPHKQSIWTCGVPRRCRFSGRQLCDRPPRMTLGCWERIDPFWLTISTLKVGSATIAMAARRLASSMVPSHSSDPSTLPSRIYLMVSTINSPNHELATDKR